ncbi:MAG: ABC transporter ATP-binding protein/permease [Clostridiales bacterium]|jgi:ABC-type bacteriocin/lantibiotic exporter with double-glycine peptidase domain|nr:ABC transporter ATP-binding protein/permease [Clostridiales bacterium]
MGKNVKVKKASSFSWLWMQTQHARLIMFALALVTVALSFCRLGWAYMLKIFSDIATGDSQRPLLFGIIFMITLILVSVPVEWSYTLLKSALFGKVEGKLREVFLTQVFRKRYIDIQKSHTGELMTLLTNDTESAANYFPTLITDVMGNITTCAFALVALFLLNWKLAVILLVVIPIIILSLRACEPLIQKASKSNKGDEETNRKFMQELLGKLLLFKAYGNYSSAIEHSKDLYANKYKSSLKLAKFDGFSEILNTIFNLSLFAIILGVGAYYAIRGEATAGTLMAMTQLTNSVINSFSRVAQYISQTAQASASVERIQKVLTLPDEPLKVTDKSLRPIALETRNVSFSYDDTEIVLKDVSLQAKPGEIVGIIGESGSGKSTITKILMGLYEPSKGKVEMQSTGGIIINDIMSKVAYVPSDNFLFAGSLQDNICMGADVDKERLIMCAKAVNIYDFVEGLPNGFDEQVGEASNTLSTGQAQRVAIARALYKDSAVLIFDEPTANLDTSNVDALLKTIKSIAKDKICIIVTHHLETKGICDRIYEISNGVTNENVAQGYVAS